MMTAIIWYVNAERQKLLDKLTDIPEYGRRKRSEIIEMAIREFIEKHGQSNNPQSQLAMFDKNTINGVPHIYRNFEAWKKFYELIKKQDDYREVDKQLNMILSLHEKKFKEFK